MVAVDGRIGRIRLKNGGADLRILPSATKRRSEHATAWFDYHTDQVRTEYASDMAGYVVAAWDQSGNFTFRVRCYGQTPSLNTLPHWLGEAARREIANFDLERRLDLPPSDR